MVIGNFAAGPVENMIHLYGNYSIDTTETQIIET